MVLYTSRKEKNNMSIKNIRFITPLINEKTYSLTKNYSHTIILNNKDEINISSDIGLRKTQEDTVTVQEHRGYLLLLVADGMGGEINGNAASYITAKKIQRWFSSLDKNKLAELDEKNIKRYLSRVINEMKDSEFPRVGGTTLNMSIIGPEKTIIINIGDSRTYTIKDNEITMRSIDDSLAFKKFNPTTKEERDSIRYYSNNNIIVNCIEMKSIAKINAYLIKNDEYDVLCHMTDGISDILPEDKIKEYILSVNPAETLVKKAITSEPEYKSYNKPDFQDHIEQYDNASAIVYTKKRIKSN